MAKSDARFDYRANLKREDHDLSQKLGFTSAAGMLLPIWFDLATPGDSYYMRHKMPLLRSSQLAAPAMVDVKVHFETFFVPAQMIYEPFENTIYSLRNFRSSNYNLFTTLRNNDFPLFDYTDFITNVINSENPDNDYHADAFRLADIMGLKPSNFLGSAAPSVANPTPFFPYQLLAYHTIFQYYYRLDDKSQFENQFSNWDKFYDNTENVRMDRDFMAIHQRPWHFDYFTSIYRSPIVSDANLQSVLPAGEYSDLSNVLVYRSSTDSQLVNNNDPLSTFRGGTTNTAIIRQMFANEKLAMITGRAKKTYDAQVLAHLGVNVPHDVKHDITMIHHDEYDLNVQEVTSLASTNDAVLGELAGKSYASGNGESFKFTAPCHGVIMTIFSVEPQKKYFDTYERCNMISDAFDVPTPEFDRLGNQPMFRGEVGWRDTSPEDPRSNVDIIGWKERYYGFKRKPNKVTYAFGYSSVNRGINNYSAYMLGFRPFATVADSLDRYPDPRPDLENRFYIERNAMDNMCMVKFSYGWKRSDSGGEDWNSTPWLVYARDPFIIDSDIQCKKVSWMSKDGEPIYL